MSTATLSPGERPETDAFDLEIDQRSRNSRSIVVEEKHDNEEGCPNCGSTQPWNGASWCPACGYYPALKRAAVDVSAESDPERVDEVDEPKSAWQEIPAWFWVLVGGLAVVAVMSFAVRFLLADSPYLSLWSWVQFAVGLTGLLVGHITAYLYACSRNDRITPFDICMKPLAIWGVTLHALPRQSRRLYLAAWGLTAALMAVFVIGGVDFSNPSEFVQLESLR